MKDKTVAIIGLGMLGGSLASRLISENACGSVIGYGRRQETVDYAIEHNIVNTASTDIKEILAQADVSIFCTPIPVTIWLVEQHRNDFKPGSLVTDIGSTKGSIDTECSKALEGTDITFIGGHPMAGSEKFGIEYYKPAMYDNATIFITPTADSPQEHIDSLDQIWSAAGAKTFVIDPAKHDEVVAYASQALHVVATASARAVLDNEDGKLCAAASAGGFRDLTRIASSNPKMWREILENNPEGNLIALNQIIGELEYAKTLLENREWDKVEEFFAHGKELRDAWLNLKG